MNDWESLVGQLGSIPLLPGARCKGRAELFDSTIVGVQGDPHNNVEYARSAAIRLCQACPAQRRCRDWLDTLPPDQRPLGVVAGQTLTRQTDSTNRKEPPMTDRTQPTYRDMERGLRVSLARRRGDDDILPMLAAECVEPVDVDMLIIGLADALNFALNSGTKDPEKFLADWITNIRKLGDDEEPDHD